MGFGRLAGYRSRPVAPGRCFYQYGTYRHAPLQAYGVAQRCGRPVVGDPATGRTDYGIVIVKRPGSGVIHRQGRGVLDLFHGKAGTDPDPEWERAGGASE